MKECVAVAKTAAQAKVMREERLKTPLHQDILKQSLTAEAFELKKKEAQNRSDEIKMNSARLFRVDKHDERKLALLEMCVNTNVEL